jgi:hypothetical protein
MTCSQLFAHSVRFGAIALVQQRINEKLKIIRSIKGGTKEKIKLWVG